MNQYTFTPPYKSAMASPRMGPRDWVSSKETKLNSSARKYVGSRHKGKSM